MCEVLPICRVCLKTSLEYIDLDTPFEDDTEYEGRTLTYLDCFLACTRLEINVIENSPQNLCSSCGLELKIAYEFLRKAELADKTLREFGTRITDIKIQEEAQFLVHTEDGTEYVHVAEINSGKQSTYASGIVLKDDEVERPFVNAKDFICSICDEQFISHLELNQHLKETHTNDALANCSQLKPLSEIGEVDVPLSDAQSHGNLHKKSSCSSEQTTGKSYVDLIEVGQSDELDLLGSDLRIINSMQLSGDSDAYSQTDQEQSGDNNINEVIDLVDDDQSKSLSEFEALTTKSKLINNESKDATKSIFTRCSVCDRYVRTSSIQTHMSFHAGVRDFSCVHCSQGFHSKRFLQAHLKSVHKEHSKLVCKICGEQLKGLDMKTHVQERHLRTIKCTQCEYEGQEVKMKDHMKRRHAESKDFLCNICSKTFCTLGVLNAHLKYHERKESKVKSDACPICGKVFSTNHYLKAHMQTHQDDRELFKCNSCDKSYHSKAALDNHTKMHKGDTIECLLCSKQFARQYELNVHMRFHTREYPFECELCEKKFAIKGHLRTHMWRHQGLKLQCEECGKLFTSTKALQEHSFCHSEMPFPCPYCTKAYPSKPKFKVHLKTVHMVEFSNEELQKMGRFNIQKRPRSKKFTLVQADAVMKEVEILTKGEEEQI